MPKHNDMPWLSNYAETPGDEFWRVFLYLSWEKGKQIQGTINPIKLYRMATKSNYPDMATVIEIIEDIKHGRDIGCRGVNLCPSVSSNAPSAYEHGQKVTDSIADGIRKGIMIGPMQKDQIPFQSIKTNDIMVKLKPDNSARIILNLSMGTPYSVNDGIDNDQFEVYMLSTVRWLRAIHLAGRGCYITRGDGRKGDQQFIIAVID